MLCQELREKWTETSQELRPLRQGASRERITLRRAVNVFVVCCACFSERRRRFPPGSAGPGRGRLQSETRARAHACTPAPAYPSTVTMGTNLSLLPFSQGAVVCVLHVTSCQDEFRQQQMAMLWRASGAAHTQVQHTRTQCCKCCGSGVCQLLLPLAMSAETFGVWTCEDSRFPPHRCSVPAVRLVPLTSLTPPHPQPCPGRG